MSFPDNLDSYQGLQSGTRIINEIDSSKFPLILNRISKCIQQSNSEELKPFSDDEEEKLLETLSVSHADLKILLDTSLYLMKQAAFNLTKPPVFKQYLSDNFKLNDDKVDAFVTVWSNQAKNIVKSLKQKSTYPKQVESVSWMLNSTVSGSETGPLLEPRAILELKLNQTGEESGNIRLDLNQTQLQTFYNTLENIQTRLDNLK